MGELRRGHRIPYGGSFEKKLKPQEDGCLVWPGATNGGGYGYVRHGDEVTTVHRLMYEKYVGAIPPDHEVHHVCHNRLCANPAHLQAVPIPHNRALTSRRRRH